MAVAPLLTTPLVAYTNADWNEQPFRFWVGNATTADSFTGCTFDATLSPSAAPGAALHLTSAGGTLTVTQPNIVAITVSAATMAGVAPGTYDFELRKTTAGGVKTIVLRGQVQIVAGLAP